MLAFVISFCRLLLTSGERLGRDKTNVRAECRLADCNAINTGQDVDILVLSLDASLDAQHLLERVFVAMLYFEVLPFRPEGGYGTWIAELRCMTVDSSSSINLTQPSFHFRKLEAHVFGFFIGQCRDGALVDRSRGREAKVRC